MSLTLQQGKDTILGVANTVALANNVTMYWQDLPDEIPDDAVTWGRAVLRHVDGDQASLSNGVGASRWAMTGNFTAQLFTPFGEGGVNALAIGQAMLAAYRAESSAVWYRNPRVREVGKSGAFYQVNFIVDFEYDQIQ